MYGNKYLNGKAAFVLDYYRERDFDAGLIDFRTVGVSFVERDRIAACELPETGVSLFWHEGYPWSNG